MKAQKKGGVIISTDNKKKRLGEILTSSGVITEEQLKDALVLQMKTGEKLGEVLVKGGFVTEDQIVKVLESQLGIKSIDLTRFYIEADAVKMIPEIICRKYTLVGIQVSGGQLLVAMKDPLDYFALEDIRLVVQFPLKQAIAPEKDIVDVIEHYYSKSIAEKAVKDFVKQYGTDSAPVATHENSDSVSEVSNAPIVRFINSIIESAVRNNASDIHIEPEEDEIRIRTRIDGILKESMVIGTETLNALISRIKIMANLNIAEKRQPQDGRIVFSLGNRDIDLRVSTLPTLFGEKVVMRVLDKSNFILSKEKLGLSLNDIEKFNRMIARPHGIIFVTGPTGSGKTSTLYAILSELNDVKRNIITLEDPVEYHVKGINQVQLNAKAGLSFAAGLRSILRQDPDVIMIGEIRDAETAEIAVRSALTGHLVLSTLHTNDAPGTISRVIDMGIEPFLLSSSMIGVIAQRLVRKICPACRHSYQPDELEAKVLGVNYKDAPPIYKGAGCQLCGGTGYKGRTAIFEVMEVDKALRILIDKEVSADELKDEAVNNGMSLLVESSKMLVQKGVSTIEELMRVAYSL